MDGMVEEVSAAVCFISLVVNGDGLASEKIRLTAPPTGSTCEYVCFIDGMFDVRLRNKPLHKRHIINKTQGP